MTNYQVRLLCYAIVIAAGGLSIAIGSTATNVHFHQDVGPVGTLMILVGAFLFFLETFFLSRKKQ